MTRPASSASEKITLPNEAELSGKWRVLILLSIAELFGMATWLSASAVVPTLSEIWNLDGGGEAWLTMSVQLGFVVGAFGSAVLNVADRYDARWLFAGSAIVAGLATLVIALAADGLMLAIPLRLLTGLALAGVYPVGMKIMATWTTHDRGLGIGLLVGALTIGTALPHLFRTFGDLSEWKLVLYLTAGFAGLAALIAIFFVREGPYATPAPRIRLSYIKDILRDKSLVRANLGYLGHMWELYAVWTWLPVFLLASFEASDIDPVWAGLMAFIFIAIGGPGSIVAGSLADRFGRTTVTSASLLISGGSAAITGFLFGASPWLLVPILLIWGFAIVADSAQFSACVTELADREYVGTALTLQTSMGFLLTLFTIRLVPVIEGRIGWEWAFIVLAIGPVIGIISMWSLRQLPEARALASGNR